MFASLFLLAGSLGVSSLGVFERPVKLAGTVIDAPVPASDFTLTDQHDLPFHMADTKGKVVVMTFIYTHCTDLCPFIAMKLKSAYDQLGKDAQKAVLVAVTTDPERDTKDVIAAYSRAAGLFDDWHFLTGPVDSVKKVWASYGIAAETPRSSKTAPATTDAAAADTEPAQGLSSGEADQARTIAARFGGGDEVTHSAPFWIIDREGRMRATMDADALPSEIVSNVRALIGN